MARARTGTPSSCRYSFLHVPPMRVLAPAAVTTTAQRRRGHFALTLSRAKTSSSTSSLPRPREKEISSMRSFSALS